MKQGKTKQNYGAVSYELCNNIKQSNELWDLTKGPKYNVNTVPGRLGKIKNSNHIFF
jgi:hypothetical protein